MDMKQTFLQLITPFEEHGMESWGIYPRPQMKRDSFLSLCGEWELSVINGEAKESLGKIRVPFPPESRISGIGRALKKGESYRYRKTFRLPEGFVRDEVLLHFGAVDQICRIFVNGACAGEHTGGYLPFSFEIASHLREGDNLLEVEVWDDTDIMLPYGKQRKKRGGMWYTPISGIWQPVWLESVPKEHIRSLKITPYLDRVVIRVEGGEQTKQVKLETGECISFVGEETEISIESPRLWYPEDPYLYRFEVICGEDRVESYFALRTVSVENVGGIPRLCLNGKPYFFHGLLDQGYFADGIYLPASPEGYRYDIAKAKAMGFNMLRKHIKIEPDVFYYECDRMGMVVFQDMVNNGKYRYIRDTVLPTIGMKKRPFFHTPKRQKEVFEQTVEETLGLLYNHPSVCYYTIFNEGWGQYDADGVYRRLKAMDSTRIFDATSGWFVGKESDVDSRHVYFRPFRIKEKSKKPLVLSEFGGYSYKIPQHSFNQTKTYGYKSFAEQEAFVRGLEELYDGQILPAIKEGLCGTVLTQLSDVEDETNGLLTYDRRCIKVAEPLMLALADRLFAEFEKTTK